METVVDGVEYLWETGPFPPILSDRIDSGFVLGLERWTGHSAERISPGYDTNNSSVDFVILNNPTPGYQHTEGIAGSGVAVLPHSMRLYSNYPNPFNGETVIPFVVGNAAGNVRLAIFNVLGRTIREYSLGFMSAGDHSVRWDSNNSTGIPAASGVYFVVLQAGNTSKTKTMTLIR
jgi:hypothetical protein